MKFLQVVHLMGSRRRGSATENCVGPPIWPRPFHHHRRPHHEENTLAALVILFAGLAPAAHAQWAVFDGANFSQNILTAGHTLQQIQNQITQLQNEATMLENEARNLSGLNLNTLPQILNLLGTTDRLIQQSQSLAFNVSQMNPTFARYYPQSYATGTSLAQLTADSQTRWSYSRGAVQTAMQLQAQATQNAATDEATLSSLVTQSQSAVGALQASQATNQLLSLIARELMQEQQLRLTQDRATALAQALPDRSTNRLRHRPAAVRRRWRPVHAANGELLQRQLRMEL